MNKTVSIKKFFGSTLGSALIFVAVFYLLTFLVYYFNGPGPEERTRAKESQQSEQIIRGNQSSSVTVNVITTQENNS